jgi:hypothetical protein
VGANYNQVERLGKGPEKEFANGGLGGVQMGDLVPFECPERIQVPCILGVVHPRCLSS